jgi:hypothetical protein
MSRTSQPATTRFEARFLPSSSCRASYTATAVVSASSAVTSLTTIRSQRLAVIFSNARRGSAPGSRAKATNHCPGRRRRASAAMTSVVGASFSVSPAAVRGILPAARRTGSKSQGAAAAITPSLFGSSARHAASISAVVTTGITRARRG